jgi:hypothetical protein
MNWQGHTGWNGLHRAGDMGSALATILAPLAAHAVPPIRRRQAGGTTAFDVHAGTSYSVSVSPDGQWLAFDLQGSLWVVPAKGGEARRITDYFNDAHLPVWSPDGSRLAYYAYRDGDYDLWTVRPDGSDARQLTHGEDDDRDPAWSPDGKTVAFASDRDGSYDIWAVDVASGATRRSPEGPREDRAPHGALTARRVFRHGRGAERHLHRRGLGRRSRKLAPRAQAPITTAPPMAPRASWPMSRSTAPAAIWRSTASRSAGRRMSFPSTSVGRAAAPITSPTG